MVKSHTHGMDHYHSTVPHKHTRGSFEITGTVSFANVSTEDTGVVSAVGGAFEKSGRPSSGQFMQSVGSGYAQNANYIDFAASRNWIGESSTESPDTYGASRQYTDSNNNNANENRPENFTVKIWKRTA